MHRAARRHHASPERWGMQLTPCTLNPPLICARTLTYSQTPRFEARVIGNSIAGCRSGGRTAKVQPDFRAATSANGRSRNCSIKLSGHQLDQTRPHTFPNIWGTPEPVAFDDDHQVVGIPAQDDVNSAAFAIGKGVFEGNGGELIDDQPHRYRPFDMKDHLKARGYRWSDGSDGRPKAWWIELAEEVLDDELHYLRSEIYRWPDADPSIRRLTAFDRFKA
jgi:hypothetical protein